VAAVGEASIRRQRAADAAMGVEAPGAAMRALEVSAGMASFSVRLRGLTRERRHISPHNPFHTPHHSYKQHGHSLKQAAYAANTTHSLLRTTTRPHTRYENESRVEHSLIAIAHSASTRLPPGHSNGLCSRDDAYPVGRWEGPPCVLVPPAVWCPPAAPPRCCVPPCGGRVPRVLPPPAVGSCLVCWCPPAVLWP